MSLESTYVSHTWDALEKRRQRDLLRGRIVVQKTKPATKIAPVGRKRKKVQNLNDPRGQFGTFLRAWIDKHHAGDSSRLAEALGVSVTTVRTWMRGDGGPAFSELESIANALGFDDWAKLATAIVRHSSR